MPCEFGETLGDRLVCGLCDKVYQKRLLSECKLTLDKALQIAQSMETADVNARAHCEVLSLEFIRCPRMEHIRHHHASHRKAIRHRHQGSKVGNANGAVAQTTFLHIVVLPVLCVVSARRRDT